MNLTKPNSYKLLRDALKKETGIEFPECLKKLNFLRYEKEIDSKCVCGVSIINKYYYYFEDEKQKKEIIIGKDCNESILRDIKLYNESSSIFDHWMLQIQRGTTAYKRATFKCTVCKTPWTEPKCFYKGMCKGCNKIRGELGKEKCQMKKYKGIQFKKILKDNVDYLIFCSRNDTRQKDIIKDYLRYNRIQT